MNDIEIDDDAPWKLSKLVERIDARAAELGVPRTTLLKRAGVQDKSVRDLETGHSPTLRRLADLARAFKFERGLAELLGVDTPPADPIDPEILRVALHIVGVVLDTPPGKNPLLTQPDIVARLASVLYQQLADLKKIDPKILQNQAALHLLLQSIKSELAK